MCGFQNLKQDPVIARCRQQFWFHLPGTEFLAANPADIPGFPFMMLEAYDPAGENVFEPNIRKKVRENETDIFRKLPAELRYLVLVELSSKDIACLRLASRPFRQLPKQLFQRLIRAEMPWFWEIDELVLADNKYWKSTLGGTDPETETFDSHADPIRRSREGKAMRNVNWMLLYQQLSIFKKGILGVRNRARVWDLSEQIVKRIAELRISLAENGLSPESQVNATESEREAGLVKNDIYCPRCDPFQIQGKRDES
jgi:hypothetical protein